MRIVPPLRGGTQKNPPPLGSGQRGGTENTPHTVGGDKVRLSPPTVGGNFVAYLSPLTVGGIVPPTEGGNSVSPPPLWGEIFRLRRAPHR